MITVSLLAATICFNAVCYPALVGNRTPVGTFYLTEKTTKYPGYGGDVIEFTENPTTIFAIHRLYLLNKKQHRDKRIKSKNPKDRVITDGCINIQPEVYEELKSCCLYQPLEVKK